MLIVVVIIIIIILTIVQGTVGTIDVWILARAVVERAAARLVAALELIAKARTRVVVAAVAVARVVGVRALAANGIAHLPQALELAPLLDIARCALQHRPRVVRLENALALWLVEPR